MKIFAFAGSLRAGSFNRKLIALAAANAQRAGADVELGDFRALCPPHYDGDVEAADGLPRETQALIAKIDWADGVIVASPEYNRSVPGPLKNAFDWLSRVKPYKLSGKKLLLIGATSGKAGCANGIAALRNSLEFQGANVFAESYGLCGAGAAFAADGSFVDPAEAARLDSLIAAFIAQG